ncbi:hypothetical protein QTP88_020184 [Uroleucon formosanum]
MDMTFYIEHINSTFIAFFLVYRQSLAFSHDLTNYQAYMVALRIIFSIEKMRRRILAIRSALQFLFNSIM